MIQCSVFKVHHTLLMQNAECIMQNQKYSFRVSRDSVKSQFLGTSINLSLHPAFLILHSAFLKFEVVGQNGLEPSTSRLSVVCSSQLSYWPISRRNQIHNVRFQAPLKTSSCVFVSPLPIKPASLGFYGSPFGLTSCLGT